MELGNNVLEVHNDKPRNMKSRFEFISLPSLNIWEQSLTNFKKELESWVETEQADMKSMRSGHVLDSS